MLSPLLPRDWNPSFAAHLLNRAGFGGTPQEVEALHARGINAAVEDLLHGGEDADLFPVPELAMEPADFVAMRRKISSASSEEEKKRIQQQMRKQDAETMRALRMWWMDRMRWSPYPLREKATLFWHGHFATSVEKVRNPYALWVQNETLRANALGNFGVMAAAISRDPAMIRYLDLNKSDRDHPNENFARELMELFMLGEGHYTEKDIQESARAFTGYRINPTNLSFVFQKRRFDEGAKTFFGKSGNFTGDDIIGLILEKPACGEFIARKMWTFFAYENPDPALVAALGTRFHESGYDISTLLRTIFLSQEFYSPSAIRTQVKSPVQWLVNTAKIYNIPLPNGPGTQNALSQLGQIPFAPPNVKGWDGGRSWISSSTLLYRYNLAGFIVRGSNLNMDKIVPIALRNDPSKVCESTANRLFNAPLPESERAHSLAFLGEQGVPPDNARLQDFLHLLMSTPEFQLT